MKKKKGFTLIELLAVIVILAIIALIATPIVLNIVEKARRSANENSAYGLIESAKLKYVEGILDGTNSAATYTFNGTNAGLEFSGSAPDSGELKVDANGNIAIAVIYGNVCYKKDYTESKITQSDDTTNCTLGGSTPTVPAVSYKCKRATTLHTETCTQTADYCYGAGYTASDKGATIRYGNLRTGAVLKSGDAFDCDVNGDGTYDATTERFYYVSDLYNTVSQTFDSNYAVLIYYSNTTLGVADDSSIAYDSSSANYQGPVTAIANLPTTAQWSNVSLSNTSRAILTETGTSSTTGGTLPTEFDYSAYAARLLAAQEINLSCEITVGPYATGDLDNCTYLMENTKFSNSTLGTFGHWLENPYADGYNRAWYVAGNYRNVHKYSVSNDSDFGVRPVIEVLKTDIEI